MVYEDCQGLCSSLFIRRMASAFQEKKKEQEREQEGEAEGADPDMMALMGFGGFGTSKR